jgi:uncharacterized DUF497 family protein
VILLPAFEFDEAKSRANAEKHGIDVHEAQELWLDPDLMRRSARPGIEPRFLFVGEIDGRCWAAVVTYRERAVRIISVRRARPKEVDAYGRQGA